MNPVMSDLAIFVRNHEIEAEAATRQRTGLVRLATGPDGGRGWFRRLVDGVHEFVDPRGFALARLRSMETVTASDDRLVEPATVPAIGADLAVVADVVCLEVEPDREEQAVAA